MILFGFPFLAGGLLVGWFYFSGVLDWWAARAWVETPCRIVAAELKESRDSESTSYRATGRYQYRWEGREYESDRVSLLRGGDNVGDYQQRVHREMVRAMRERDGAALCYVNPWEPKESVMVRELRVQQAALMILFCLLFPFVGALVMYGGWGAMRSGWAEKRRQKEYPDEPWKWNAVWNTSPMPESASSTGSMLLPLAVWWALVTVPLLAAGVVDGVFQRSEGFWMIIPGVFCAAAVWMVLRWVRERVRIGAMWLDVALPLRPGREISGAWITAKPLRPHDVPVMQVSCIKTVATRSGRDRSTHTETIWEKEESLSVIDQTREITAFHLPFRFRLPVDVEETTFEESGTKIEWKLAFWIPGTPVKSTFAVPVCRDSSEPLLEKRVDEVEGNEGNSKAADAERRLPELLDKARVDAMFDGKGHLTSLVCGPKRWLASIVFLMIFNVMWTGFAVFLWYSAAPMVFKIVWPVTAAASWLLVFYQMVSRYELRLENGEAHVTRKILLYQSHVVVPVDAVVSVLHQSNTSVNSTHYYWVKLVTAGGKRITVASGIAGEPAALGVVRQLERWRKGRA